MYMYMLKLIASKVPHTQQVYDVQPFEIMKAEWMHAPRVIMMFQPATRSIAELPFTANAHPGVVQRPTVLTKLEGFV